MKRERRAFVGVAAIAVLARLVVIAWAASRFPPAGDGTYYDILGRRLAAGLGYTWAWPDGAVTYAAHYPVGYPALLGVVYTMFGPHPVAGMALNAAFGVAAALAAQSLVARSRGVARGFAAGLIVALHPALLLYTPALMTEGIAASLCVLAAWGALVPRRAVVRIGVAGVLLGVATLVRPQLVVLAPVLGFLAAPALDGVRRWRAGGAFAVACTAVALTVTTPWILRNCSRMDRCGLTFNGGWNLLIGTQTRDGAWAPVEVPEACRTVLAEAAKDACFGQEARARIEASPLAFVAEMPRKVAVTFDYFGGAPWYLHTANASAFSERAKVTLGAVETLVARLALIAALLAAGARAPRTRVRYAGALLGVVLACTRHAWPAYGLLAALSWPRSRAVRDDDALGLVTAAVIVATAATHAVFFGAGRYGLIVVPLVSAVAATCGPLRSWGFDGKRRGSTPHEGSLATLARAPREESPSSTEHDAG